MSAIVAPKPEPELNLQRSNAANILRKREADKRTTALLTKCRELMAAGNFRPSGAEIAGAAVHDIVNRGGIKEIYDQALDMDTIDVIAVRVVGEAATGMSPSQRTRLALAVVYGRSAP